MPTHQPHLVDPAAHPEYSRRSIQVPTWDTMRHKVHFCTLRAFSFEGNRMVNLCEDLDLYTREYRLGDFIWPVYRTLERDNAADLIDEIKNRGLFLFDVWGGANPKPGMLEWLRSELGERFIGFDNGEQDGRYIGLFSEQQCPQTRNRFGQYLNFQRHFERLGNDMGNQMSALISLSYGHYFAKEGNHTLLGAETAQSLPNGQIYYAFIRGACKQYGLLWFGNASVFNRWGYKTYEVDEFRPDDANGISQGTSLSLLKRLMYSHYLYNSVAIGFEQSWFVGDNTEKRMWSAEPIPMDSDRSLIKLSPIGHIQAEAVKFTEKHGLPGTMHTPVALLLDFFSGWAVPRHLYADWVQEGATYRVWGTTPYGPGDYLTHGVLSEIYPGYEDASYYHDERGFLSPTPYGDCADVLLSDAPEWVLRQYGLIVCAGELTPSVELADKLRSFAENGGRLLVTMGNASRLFPDLVAAGETTAVGQGAVIIEASEFGIERFEGEIGSGRCEIEKPLPNPYPLTDRMRGLLQDELKSQMLFRAPADLHLVTCRRGKGEYTVGLFNNALVEKPFRIESLCGKILEIEELALSQSEKTEIGYAPTGFHEVDLGISTQETIAGLDVRLFRICVEEENVQIQPAPTPTARPSKRLLSLRGVKSLKEAILARPTFFQHFDGVSIDWTYLRDRDVAAVEREASWLSRQQVRVVVDFSPGMNLFPDLALVDTRHYRNKDFQAASGMDSQPDRSTESRDLIGDVLRKCAILGVRDCILSLHRMPEGANDADLTRRLFIEGLQNLCADAAALSITLHLQPHPQKAYGTLEATREFVGQVGAPNLRLCVNTGHADICGELTLDKWNQLKDEVEILLIGAPTVDVFGQKTDGHLPVRGSHCESVIRSIIAASSTLTTIADADFENVDDEYLETLVWQDV